MFKNKKAQGLPLNVVIIAVIVLIVLIVLWVIFTGRASKFSEKVSNTDENIDAIGIDQTTGELTNVNKDILRDTPLLIPFIPFWRKRRRLIDFNT